MPSDLVSGFFASLITNPWIIGQILFVLGLLLYIAFAVIVWRQVKMMSKTVEGVSEMLIRLLSILHLAFAVGVLILALVIL